jgi:nitrilase
MSSKLVKLGIAQFGPVYQDLEASMEKLGSLISRAARHNIQVLVFGECWLSGYPAWLDYCPEAAFWDHLPVKKVFANTYKNSITVPGNETRLIGGWAKQHGITLLLGVNERVETGIGNGSLYNSLLTFTADGKLANHHRKLRPTFTERLIHSPGDGQGLQSVKTPLGRVGGLICWEHWMPLSRMAMHLSGEHIHAAVWPTVHEMHQVASRSYAFEGRCFVASAGQLMQAREIPEGLTLPKHSGPDDYLMKGGSCIIGPDGSYLAEPLFEREGFITADIDTDRVLEERMNLDTTGHYNRYDVFNLTINRERKQ